jgi:hypothetical protein
MHWRVVYDAAPGSVVLRNDLIVIVKVPEIIMATEVVRDGIKRT